MTKKAPDVILNEAIRAWNEFRRIAVTTRGSVEHVKDEISTVWKAPPPVYIKFYILTINHFSSFDIPKCS